MGPLRIFGLLLIPALSVAVDECLGTVATDDESFSTLQLRRVQATDGVELLDQNKGLDIAGPYSHNDDICTCKKGAGYATADQAHRGDIEKLPTECGGMCVLNGWGQCRKTGINGDAKTGETHEKCRQRCMDNNEIGRDGLPIDPCQAIEVRLPRSRKDFANGNLTSCEFYRRVPNETLTNYAKGAHHRCWIRTTCLPPTPTKTGQSLALSEVGTEVLCCQALTATCLACMNRNSVEDYCKLNPKTDGCHSHPTCGPPEEKFALPHKGCPNNNTDLTTCVAHNQNFATFAQAWAACGELTECGLVMRFTNGRFYLRRLSDPDLTLAGAASMLHECPGPSCPDTVPTGGGCPKGVICDYNPAPACHEGLVCDYNPVACGENTIFSSTATCTGDGWLIAKRDIYCPPATPGFCDAPEEEFTLPVKGCPIAHTDLTSCVSHNRNFDTFKEAWAACGVNAECGLVTRFSGRFYLRRLSDPDLPHVAGAGSMLHECTDCPLTPPTHGTKCTTGLECDYEEDKCNGNARGFHKTLAWCGDDGWSVITRKECWEIMGLRLDAAPLVEKAVDLEG